MTTDKFSQMTVKMAVKQLAILTGKSVTQVKPGSSDCTWLANDGHMIVGNARDLLRELSEEITKANNAIEWF